MDGLAAENRGEFFCDWGFLVKKAPILQKARSFDFL
jgi:hypothetical protein